MNQQQAIQFLPLVQAMAEGKAIQLHYSNGWIHSGELDFTVSAHRYRIKPEPVTRPWSKPEDVPVMCWVSREVHDESETCIQGASLVIGLNERGIIAWCINDGRIHGQVAHLTWSEIERQNLRYSTDRKNWQPCVVTEAA